MSFAGSAVQGGRAGLGGRRERCFLAARATHTGRLIAHDFIPSGLVVPSRTGTTVSITSSSSFCVLIGFSVPPSIPVLVLLGTQDGFRFITCFLNHEGIGTST